MSEHTPGPWHVKELAELAGIAWYERWRQHVFVPEGGTVFSFDCMEDIAARVKAMNEAQAVLL